MGDGESGASIVQVNVPEFSSIDFQVVKKRECVIRTRPSNDKQNFQRRSGENLIEHPDEK